MSSRTMTNLWREGTESDTKNVHQNINNMEKATIHQPATPENRLTSEASIQPSRIKLPAEIRHSQEYGCYEKYIHI